MGVTMQYFSSVTVVVPDYDEAIAFYVGKLGFSLAEDTPFSSTKRWVVVMPPGATETGLLLAKADRPEQHASIGAQSGGGVFLIRKTNDFDRDYARFVSQGIEFLEVPRSEAYAKVVVFRDVFGNTWDLIGPLAKKPV
jgi:catechol 2,3-dioxygenase-like lactoylglutathione lyase family enzyme